MKVEFFTHFGQLDVLPIFEISLGLLYDDGSEDENAFGILIGWLFFSVSITFGEDDE